MLNDLKDRNSVGQWLNEHNLTGDAVEVGCAFGGFSRTVLPRWNGRLYHMVDLWARQPKEIYRENTEAVNYDGWMRDCLKLSERDRRVRLHRSDSVKAASEFADNSLDFVYIDANHSYEAVMADIEAWWPKVRSGGLFGGHDHYDDTNPPHYCEVKRAVTEWAKKMGLEITLTPCSSWWVVKP